MAYGETKKEKEIAAFSGDDLYKLYNACSSLGHTHIGLVAEPYTIDELAELFCPPHLLSSAQQVYSVESRANARGYIYLNLHKLLPPQLDVFEEPDAKVTLNRACLRFQFDRDNAPNGFVTPDPVFGKFNEGVGTFAGRPNEALRKRFVDHISELLNAAGKWSTVRWVLETLQGSVRTPLQIRYLWPAIYTLGAQGRIRNWQDLAEPSSRAALNATMPTRIAPFLKPTYEVVANSVLLGAKEEYINRYINGQMHLTSYAFTAELNNAAKERVHVGGI